MALQNRVDPWERLVSVNARGRWLGNRGILHNKEKEIVALWKRKEWVICQLEFKQRKGAKRNRLFICGTTGLYSVYVTANGCKLGWISV